MYKVLWFTRLKPEVSAESYKQFVQEVDYPAASRIPSIIRYTSVQVQGPATGEGEVAYDFVDIAEVEDVDAYRQELETHPAAEIRRRRGYPARRAFVACVRRN